MNGDEVLERFESRGVTRGGELYLAPGIALEAVSALDESDIAVIGIEAVRLEGDYVEPDPSQIADCADTSALTWQSYRETANRCSRGFLAGLPARANLHVTLTTQSEQEWRGF